MSTFPTPADPNVTPLYPTRSTVSADDLGLMRSETREDYLHRVRRPGRADAIPAALFHAPGTDAGGVSMLPASVDRNIVVVGPSRLDRRADAFALQSTEELSLVRGNHWPLSARLMLLSLPTFLLLVVCTRRGFERDYPAQSLESVVGGSRARSGNPAQPAIRPEVIEDASRLAVPLPLLTALPPLEMPVTKPRATVQTEFRAEVRTPVRTPEAGLSAVAPIVAVHEATPSADVEPTRDDSDDVSMSRLLDTPRSWSVPGGISPAEAQRYVGHIEALVGSEPVSLSTACTHFDNARRITESDARLHVAFGLFLERHHRAVEAHEAYRNAVECQQTLASRSQPGHFEPYFLPYRELIRSGLVLAAQNPESLEPALLTIEDLLQDMNSQLPAAAVVPWQQAERRANVRFLSRALAVLRDLYGSEADRRFDLQQRHDRVVAQLTPDERALFAQVESETLADIADLRANDDARLAAQQRRQEQRQADGYYARTDVHIAEDFRTVHHSQTNWCTGSVTTGHGQTWLRPGTPTRTMGRCGRGRPGQVLRVPEPSAATAHDMCTARRNSLARRSRACRCIVSPRRFASICPRVCSPRDGIC